MKQTALILLVSLFFISSPEAMDEITLPTNHQTSLLTPLASSIWSSSLSVEPRSLANTPLVEESREVKCAALDGDLLLQDHYPGQFSLTHPHKEIGIGDILFGASLVIFSAAIEAIITYLH